jgi:hypothetical protein
MKNWPRSGCDRSLLRKEIKLYCARGAVSLSRIVTNSDASCAPDSALWCSHIHTHTFAESCLTWLHFVRKSCCAAPKKDRSIKRNTSSRRGRPAPKHKRPLFCRRNPFARNKSYVCVCKWNRRAPHRRMDVFWAGCSALQMQIRLSLC